MSDGGAFEVLASRLRSALLSDLPAGCSIVLCDRVLGSRELFHRSPKLQVRAHHSAEVEGFRTRWEKSNGTPFGHENQNQTSPRAPTVLSLGTMATQKKTAQQTEAGGGDVLQDAAKTIGSALGTFARKTGLAHALAGPKPSGKLVKKAKKRLPRKLKKQAKKTAQSKP